jgi:predicted aldo/keto reductase-like oxidoreductase
MLGKGRPIEKFRKAKEKGIIRHACFSSHDSPENIIKLIDTDEFEGILVQYNLLDRRNEQAIAHAHKKGLGVAIMGPIGGGRLTAPSEKMKKFIRNSNSTPEIALRFVLSNPNVTIALSGMTTIDMVNENVTVASRKTPLSAKEKKRISKALDKVKKLTALYCTGCGYCMPCPNNVDIPGNFKAMNLYRVWGLEETARERFKQMKNNKKRKWAKACTSCGECEPKCPQNIPIIKQLKETTKTLSK